VDLGIISGLTPMVGEGHGYAYRYDCTFLSGQLQLDDTRYYAVPGGRGENEVSNGLIMHVGHSWRAVDELAAATATQTHTHTR